jgi:hypothetical protein
VQAEAAAGDDGSEPGDGWDGDESFGDLTLLAGASGDQQAAVAASSAAEPAQTPAAAQPPGSSKLKGLETELLQLLQSATALQQHLTVAPPAADVAASVLDASSGGSLRELASPPPPPAAAGEGEGHGSSAPAASSTGSNSSADAEALQQQLAQRNAALADATASLADLQDQLASKEVRARRGLGGLLDGRCSLVAAARPL